MGLGADPCVLRLSREALEQESRGIRARRSAQYVSISSSGTWHRNPQIDEQDVIALFAAFLGKRELGLRRYIGDIDRSGALEWADLAGRP